MTRVKNPVREMMEELRGGSRYREDFVLSEMAQIGCTWSSYDENGKPLRNAEGRIRKFSFFVHNKQKLVTGETIVEHPPPHAHLFEGQDNRGRFCLWHNCPTKKEGVYYVDVDQETGVEVVEPMDDEYQNIIFGRIDKDIWNDLKLQWKQYFGKKMKDKNYGQRYRFRQDPGLNRSVV